MPERIHNIGILAHVDSGKTTLTEQLLYLTGAIRHAGSVDSGTAATDSLSVEKQRGISVRTATASTQWKGITINIIDTPGHVDFAGEVERAIAALDYAVVIVSAVEGVRAHTELILRSLDTAKLPYAVFINKIDRAGADTRTVINELKQTASRQLFLLTETENEGFENPSVRRLSEESFAVSATEVLAEICDEAADTFLEEKVLSESRAKELVKSEIAGCRLVPVMCGSAKHSIGVEAFADMLVEFMPSAQRRATDDLCGIIFKIEHDKALGKVSHIRLFGGEIANRDEIELISPVLKVTADSDAVEIEEKPPVKEKISQIKGFSGAKYTDTGIVRSGNIAAVCGLPSAKTGFFVGSLAVSDTAKLVNPFLRVRVTPADGDSLKLPALAAALGELSDEEPYIDAKWENGQKEITISTTGKIQLEVLDNLLRERYNLAAHFSPPTVIYKETPSGAGYARARYTMPKPCWAVVEFLFEPMPRGYGVSYHGRLPSNQCFYRYQSHIRTSFNSCLEQGLYGWEVTDFKCTLVGGEHHTIHTHPLDFFVCTPMAFMNGLNEIGSTILEPLLKIRVSCPAELSGKVLSEIVKTGGEYDSPLTFGDTAVLEAIVPVATSMDFPARLAVLSSGKAVLSQSFYGYRECRDGLEHVNPRRGVNPLDRSKWILYARGAYQKDQKTLQKICNVFVFFQSNKRKGGENVADFEKIYKEHSDFIQKYLLKICKNPSLAEELTQETFFRAYMNLSSLRNPDKVSVWLCQIAKNTYYAWYNDHKTLSSPDTENEISDNCDIESLFEQKELTEKAFICLHKLDEPYKEVFMLSVFGQLSFKDISKLFGKSESWARVTFYRAKQKLNERMR